MNQPAEKKLPEYRTEKLRLEHLQGLLDADFQGDWFVRMQFVLPHGYTRRQFTNDLVTVWRKVDDEAKAMTAKADGLWKRIRNERDKS